VFDVERKNSYLDRSLINAWISDAKHRPDNAPPMLLLARYVPMPSGERLVEAGVNFVDRAGNMHLALGSHYSRTIIGRREVKAAKEAKPPTAAKAQLVFAFAAFDDAPIWSVRQLAGASGISKSNVAKLRKQFVKEGGVTSSFHRRNRKERAGELLRAYEVLRPRQLINRFRAPNQSTEVILRNLRATFATTSTKWSLTG